MSNSQVEAQKPSWQAGTSAPLNLAARSEAKNTLRKGDQQKLQLDLESGGDNDLIDDDALLTEEDLQRPAPGLSKSRIYS